MLLRWIIHVQAGSFVGTGRRGGEGPGPVHPWLYASAPCALAAPALRVSKGPEAFKREGGTSGRYYLAKYRDPPKVDTHSPP
jgi:hypothetical protein